MTRFGESRITCGRRENGCIVSVKTRKAKDGFDAGCRITTERLVQSMTGKEMMDRAVQLGGYTNRDGVPDSLRDADLYKRGLAFVNQIYADLFFGEQPVGNFEPLTSMDVEIPLSERCVHDVMPYGVGMLLAQSEGDATTQSMLSFIYNQKRSGVFKTSRKIIDALPTGEW